jgi:uncharacterized protein YjeT (DUF2065 family)
VTDPLAIGLMLIAGAMIVEGLAYALAPSLVERALMALRALSESLRRQIGLLIFVTGLIVLWFALNFVV